MYEKSTNKPSEFNVKAFDVIKGLKQVLLVKLPNEIRCEIWMKVVAKIVNILSMRSMVSQETVTLDLTTREVIGHFILTLRHMASSHDIRSRVTAQRIELCIPFFERNNLQRIEFYNETTMNFWPYLSQMLHQEARP